MARMTAPLLWVALLLPRPGTCADIEVTVHDPAGAPLANVVVYADPESGVTPTVTSGRATIDQVDREFVPAVSVVRTGTDVYFPNSDNIRHSIYSFSAPKVFTIRLYNGREAPPVRFDKPGLVVLGCNIHDMMVAWLVVVDTPWYGKTAADGRLTLHGLDAGLYKVHVWYPSDGFAPSTDVVRLGEAGRERRHYVVDPADSPLPAVLARIQKGH